jgi:hypothetical protein
VDKLSDSPAGANRPANDSAAAQLGDVARKVSAARRLRSEIAGTSDLFSDPAWDILLHLFIAGCEGRRLSVSAVCASAVAPESTALRWIAILETRGMIVREGAPGRAFIKLTGPTNASLADYFGKL